LIASSNASWQSLSLKVHHAPAPHQTGVVVFHVAPPSTRLETMPVALKMRARFSAGSLKKSDD
jgi:hypothetical protein